MQRRRQGKSNGIPDATEQAKYEITLDRGLLLEN